MGSSSAVAELPGRKTVNQRGNWQANALGPGLYTRQQLADEVGVSRDTVKRWQREGLLLADMERGYYVFDCRALQIARRLVGLQNHNLETRMSIIEREFGETSNG